MEVGISNALNSIQLSEFSDQITKEYYEVAYLKGKQAISKLNYLKSTLAVIGVSDILQDYEMLVNDMQKYHTQRLVYFVPYLKELSEKNDGGHNCGTCSGKCDMHHSARLLDFTLSLQEVKQSLKSNEAILNEEYEGVHSEVKQLHIDIQNIGKMLNELFIIEEATLLPKITAAQKKINATR